MSKTRMEHGSAVVHIGITGNGVVPNYRVSPEGKWWGEGKTGEEIYAYFVAFNGQNHECMDWGIDELVDSRSWSTKHMTWDEVRTFLGELRTKPLTA